MSEPDRRVFMFRGKEPRLFNSPEEVPVGEGWKDHPHDLDEAPTPSDTLREQLVASIALNDAPAAEEDAKPAKKKGKKSTESEEPSEPVSDGDGN